MADIFAPRFYHQSIIRRMVRAGYELLAWRIVDSSQTPYHDKCCEAARENLLFFVRPGHALLIRASHLETLSDLNCSYRDEQENDGRRYRNEWDIRFLAYGLKDLSDEWAAREENIMTTRREVFKHDTRSWLHPLDFSYDHMANIGLICHDSRGLYFRFEPMYVVSMMTEMVGQVIPILADRFPHLNVASFSPSMKFNEGGKLFWKGFPRRRLQKIAVHVHYDKP